MRLIILALLLALSVAPSWAAEKLEEIPLPSQLIEQIYAYLQTKPYADVAPLIDGMRAAAAQATKSAAAHGSPSAH